MALKIIHMDSWTCHKHQSLSYKNTEERKLNRKRQRRWNGQLRWGPKVRARWDPIYNTEAQTLPEYTFISLDDLQP